MLSPETPILLLTTGGTIDKVEKWGSRRLAYKVDRYKEGIYVLLQFSAEAEIVKEYERRLRVQDATAGFKCFRREALEALPLNDIRSQGYNFQIEMAMRCQRAGLRVVEFPIHFAERSRGTSKMTPQIALEALWRVWQLAILVR